MKNTTIINTHKNGISLIDFEKDENGYFKGVAEISVLQRVGEYSFDPWNDIQVRSSWTNEIAIFQYQGVDFADPSHEDVAGWNYTSVDKNGKSINLLIIND